MLYIVIQSVFFIFINKKHQEVTNKKETRPRDMFKQGRFIHLDYLHQNRQNVMFSPKTTDQSVTSARHQTEALQSSQS